MAAFEPIRFPLRVGFFKRPYRGEWGPDGLRLRKGAQEFLLPVGTAAEHIAGNRIALDIGGQRAPFQVVGLRVYQYRLAEHLIAFLKGQRTAPDPDGYKVPIRLLASVFAGPVLLPLLIGFGGSIWWYLIVAFVSGATGNACFLIVQNERRSLLVRTCAAWTVALGISLMVCGGFLAFYMQARVNANLWASFDRADGKFGSVMPGTPERRRERLAGPAGPEFVLYESQTTVPKATWRIGYAAAPVGEQAISYFDRIQSGAAASRGAQVVGERAGFGVAEVWREFELKPDAGDRFHVIRVYWVARPDELQMYFLEVVAYPPLTPNAVGVQRFFHNFHPTFPQGLPLPGLK